LNTWLSNLIGVIQKSITIIIKFGLQNLRRRKDKGQLQRHETFLDTVHFRYCNGWLQDFHFYKYEALSNKVLSTDFTHCAYRCFCCPEETLKTLLMARVLCVSGSQFWDSAWITYKIEFQHRD